MAVRRPLVTNFKQRDGSSGPVIGALQIINLQLHTALVTNTTDFMQVHLPAGMGFEITDVTVFASTITAEVALTVGDTAAGTQVVASALNATGATVHTVKDGTIDAGGLIDVRFISDTTGLMALPVSINITGHVIYPPTSVEASGTG